MWTGDRVRLARRGRRIAAVLCAAALGAGALVAAGCGSDDLPEGAVARVGDNTITEAALERQLEKDLAGYAAQGAELPEEGTEEYADLVADAERQSLQTLIQQHIIAAEARICGSPCAVGDDDITAELSSIIETEFNDSAEDFDTFLEERKLTRVDARAIVRSSLQQQRLQEHVVGGAVSEDDAREYYDENQEQFTTPAGRHASHILVATEAEAQAIRDRVTVDNFAEIASEESTDAGSAPQGGDLGAIQPGQFVPEFEEAAMALEDGGISDPVQTQFGWHIITVSVEPESVQPFDEVKDAIIANRRQTAFSEWAQETISSWEDRTVYARDDLRPADPEAIDETAPEQVDDETPDEAPEG